MDTIFIFGSKYLFIIPVIGLIWWFFTVPSQSRRNLFIYIFSSLGLTLLIGKIANYFIYNPRPFVVNDFIPLVEHASDNGFPSDHMLLVAGIASVITFYNKKVGLVLWLLALFVGYSRVYVGVHHYVDIFGSVIIALFSSTVIYLVFRKRRMI